jgi:beta-lactamase regulating signal transducer with metallopeptidase domain
MYFLLGASVKLAFLLLANLVAAVAATLVWRLIADRLKWLSPHTRAQLIFALRVGPVLLAFVFVFGFVVPAYLIHEPEDSGEVVTFKLALIAGLACAALLLTTIRVIRTWRITRRLEASWLENAVEISLDGAKVPVLRMDHPFPVIAVVGILRPRIFIAETALKTLTPEELRAAIAHEEGHVASHDNLKRSVLRMAHDMLLIPIGRDLDAAWARDVEAAADEYATRQKRGHALELASAILKLARIAPTVSTNSATAFLLGDKESEVNDRVRRLIMLADGTIPVNPGRFSLSAPAWIWPLAVVGLFFLHLADQSILLTTHDAIERFVSITQ